jgi:AcrR family transcriptional regulator
MARVEPHRIASDRVSQSAPPRRAPWSGRPPTAQPESSPDKILDAAVTCIRRHGVEHTSISAVATIAGVSRPTVYAHFSTREALVSAALEKAYGDIAAQVVARARQRSKTASEFVVEALVAARREFRAEPALNPVDWIHSRPWNSGQVISETGGLGIVRTILLPILSYDPALEPQLDEIAETSIRWLLSLLMFDSARTSSETALRAYLRRAYVPALKLPS